MDFPHCFLILLRIYVIIFSPFLFVGSLDVVLSVWNTERAGLVEAPCFITTVAAQSTDS